ncbi:two-component system, OmpR family, sensor histidine kinase KdpD [Rhizobiales bacterium GAS113]|nr:two-component system, OmpR family, sensor histidine kinase KdpD [Rhizobiales bacterium GAS113]
MLRRPTAMRESRPDPDALLRVVSEDAKRHGRGQLKIFFGASAGVGKTYAMLLAARQRHGLGLPVGVGIVETHDRDDTRRLLEGLPQLPLRMIEHHGRQLHDFHLDAALASNLQLVLVDDLAHANLPGSRHAKRWQDVEELVAEGVDVYTTLNVQHLESLSDIVFGILGIRVRETVPDRVFNEAADVVLVDLPPDDLLARLGAGQVYLAGTVEYARRNYFRKGNLIALRELALRRVADTVNSDITSYRIHNAIGAVWPTRERLLVCVSADKSQERLILEGSRLAQRLQAEWSVVHIDRPEITPAQTAREHIRELAKHAERLGAEFLNISGGDVAEALLDCARTRNATKLILGQGTRSWNRPWRRRLAERIARTNPELGLLLIGVKTTTSRPTLRRDARMPAVQLGPLALATVACALTTALAGWLFQFFDPPNLVMLFTLTVVVVALRLGRAAGAWAALLSVGSFDFFFIEPRLSFAVTDTQYLFTFALFLVVALVTSELGARLQAEARVARAGERRESAVARVARDLSGAMKVDQIVSICTDTIAPLFEASAVLLLPDLTDRLMSGSGTGFVDLSAAQWAYDHVQAAGLGTQTLSASAAALYLPLKAPIRPRGVLAIRPKDRPLPWDPDDMRLLDACCSSIALALERIHFAEMAQETLVRMEGERLRNSLLAAVSHDLRTPLTAIRGLAETLEQATEISSVVRMDVASAIRRQAEELQRLVTNLLDLARMQSAGIRLNKEWHSLDEIVGSVLSRLGPALAKRRVRTDLPSDLPLVEVDASLIERVLANLIDNALKYTGADSTILIGAKALEDSMYCFVEDDGPGLPTSEPESLFEPFTRGQKETSIPGVGLGLALCRSIIDAHKGTIRGEPRHPTGARFEFRLPLGSPPEIEKENTA